MLKDIVDARPLGGYKVWLKFEDGVEGELDLGEIIRFRGVFESLRDEAEFAKFEVDPELGTIVWPNGSDLDPDVLYAAVSNRPIDVMHEATDAGRQLARRGGSEPALKSPRRRRQRNHED